MCIFRSLTAHAAHLKMRCIEMLLLLVGALGSRWGSVELLWGLVGGRLGCSGASLGVDWGALGLAGGRLSCSGTSLGVDWVALGTLWGSTGLLWGLA